MIEGESRMATPGFWNGRRVFLTGHTGFKGRWLSAWLASEGAEVTGFSVDEGAGHPDFPDPEPEVAADLRGDIRDAAALKDALAKSGAEVVLHLAAQSIVAAGYADPVGTYATNLMGTVNVLEAVRQSSGVKALVVVTTDKCYENREWVWPYRENERLGGHDPYSNSKACAELAVQAYRQSFFETAATARTFVASARAGNVIGAGDWSQARLAPDIVRGILLDRPAPIRSPGAVRPWQHVLEPLFGYLLLARRLVEGGAEFEGAWNFGPQQESEQPVSRVADAFCSDWGRPGFWSDVSREHEGGHEARILTLDSHKANALLGWWPRLSFEETLRWTAEGYRARTQGEALSSVMARQIAMFRATETR